jgi:hypothetical protein
MRWIVVSLAACMVAGCGSSLLTSPPPVVQSSAEVEPEPATAPRPRRAAGRPVDPTAPAAQAADNTNPYAYNSPEWKEREKRRDEVLNRKIYNICRGC